jgi:hypothetical protein
MTKMPSTHLFAPISNFAPKFESGKEVGRGHFGHTSSANGKKRHAVVKLIWKNMNPRVVVQNGVVLDYSIYAVLFKYRIEAGSLKLYITSITFYSYSNKY